MYKKFFFLIKYVLRYLIYRAKTNLSDTFFYNKFTKLCLVFSRLSFWCISESEWNSQFSLTFVITYMTNILFLAMGKITLFIPEQGKKIYKNLLKSGHFKFRCQLETTQKFQFGKFAITPFQVMISKMLRKKTFQSFLLSWGILLTW